jgi:Protein of unknown function (DUF2384)
MTSTARRSTNSSKLTSPGASEVIAMFAEHNPTINRAQVESVGKLVAEFGAAAAEVSLASLQRLTARRAMWRKLIKKIVAEQEPVHDPQHLVPKAPTETRQGAGLGAMLSKSEGHVRLENFATSVTPEVWAGPLVGPTELGRDFGIARSTLHNWQKQGAVIGVLVGTRKHAFPREQFIDGRPVAGLAPLVQTIGDTRTAWRWLREPNPGLSGKTPLSRLKAGEMEVVLELARSNFGRA